MKCYKCGLFTRVFRVKLEDWDKGLPLCLCGDCAVKFIEQLSLWEDFDIRGELEYWKTGIQKDD